jgi:hypothetical protein
MAGSVTKLPKFLDKMRELLDDPTTVILTNKEVWVLVNHHLPREDKVAFVTFEKWLKPSSDNHYAKLETLSDEDKLDFEELLNFTRVKQKMGLTKEMLDPDTKNKWGAAWILERKFKDLKLNQEKAAVSSPTIKITVGSDDHKDLIDGILNGTQDIAHEEVDETLKIDKE